MKKLILIVFLLTGCSHNYTRGNLSQQEIDRAKCELIAQQNSGSLYVGRLWIAAIVSHKVKLRHNVDNCMKLLGYRVK